MRRLLQAAILVALFAGVLIYGFNTLELGPPRCDHWGVLGLVRVRVASKLKTSKGSVALTNIRTTNASASFAACTTDITVTENDRAIPYVNVYYVINANPGSHWAIDVPGW